MSEHWYGLTHEDQVIPVYTLPSIGSGKPRSVSVRDVRKASTDGISVFHNGEEVAIKRLLPSVTTITGILAKAQLEYWKTEQILKAAFEFDKGSVNKYETYAAIVRDKAFAYTDAAKDFGKKIHKCLEMILESGKLDDVNAIPLELRSSISPVIDWIKDKGFTDFKCETAVAIASPGYAGLVDVICKSGDKTIVLDFKTKGTKVDQPIFQSIEYTLQLAAYAYALLEGDVKDTECYNIYISSKEMGRVDIVEVKDTKKHADAFVNLVNVFNYTKGINYE